MASRCSRAGGGGCLLQKCRLWLPARAEYKVSARILLLKAFREGSVSEFSSYKKFSVDTSTTISAPQ